eukprot:scaffold158_cov105-Cylindrotheca_fusiformis.AAC.25
MGLLPDIKSPRNIMPAFTFKDVDNCVQSYVILQRIPNYSERTGLLIFRKFFDVCPDAIPLFSFGNELTETDDGLEEEGILEKNPRFMRHINLFMNRISRTMDMMGPDLDSVQEEMIDFARRHKGYGVTREHHHMMRNAILEAFQTMLGNELKPEVMESWEKLTSFTMRAMQTELD